MLTRLLAFPAALLMLANLLTSCGGAEERKASYLERGRKYFAEHNYDKAKVEFKNVLQINPKTAKPYFYLGQIEEDRQNWREAFAYYQMAVELDGGDLGAKVKLAKFYLLANQKQKGSELVEAVLQARPDEVDARMLKAGIANTEGKRDDAIAQLERLIAQHPTRSDAYVLLAMLQMQKNDAQAAVRVLQQGIEKNEGNAALLLSLAKLELQLNRPEKAEEILKRLIAAEPGNLEHRAMLANLYIQLKRSQEAEDVLRTAIQADPKDARRYVLLAEFFLKSGNQDRAIQEMVKAVRAYPGEATLRFALAGLYEQLNQRDKAQTAYLAIVEELDSKPDVLRAKNRLAVLALAGRQTDQALKLIEEVLAESSQDTQALLLQGRIALAQKEPQKAISSFRAILKDQPDSVEVLTLLAKAHMLDGKPALAQESLEKAIAAKPEDFHAHKRLVEFFVQQKNLAAALEKANDYLKLQPKSLDGFNLKADVLALSDDRSALEALLSQMKKDFPDRAVGAFRLGQFYQKQKKYDAALAEYEAGLQRSDNDYEPLKSIIGVYLEMQQSNKALARLKKLIADKPKHPTAYQLLALYYMNQKRDDEAAKALKQAIETNPRWILPYINLADLYERKERPRSAVETYEEALKLFPDDPTLLIGLARLHEINKDYAAAIRQYEAILSRNPDDLLAANNLASVLSIEGAGKADMEKALTLAKSLENSGEPIFMDTLAWIYYQTGDYDKALPLMRKVVEKAAQEPIFQYHMGMVYSRKGDPAMAKEHLKKAVESGKNFTGLDEAKETLMKL